MTYSREVEDLQTKTRVSAYIKDGAITTWPGQHIGHVVGRIKVSTNRLTGGKLWTFCVLDVLGQTWAARHYPASGDYVLLRKVGS